VYGTLITMGCRSFIHADCRSHDGLVAQQLGHWIQDQEVPRSTPSWFSTN